MTTAGSAGSPLHKKLGIRDASRVCVLAAPRGWAIADLPLGATVVTSLAGRARFDVLVAFCLTRAVFERGLPRWRARMTPAAGLWIAWPKRAANIATDMTEHVVRAVARATGLVDNKVCAIDDVWTGLRLVIRRELR